MSNSFKVDISPDMNMYKLLQSQSYSVHSALSEFVDNSIQSFIDNKKAICSIDKKNISLKIKISIDTQKKEIIILDNASGINRENFQRAIKMGTNTIHKKTSLSKFGVGMKTSAVWFSNTWIIETSALSSKEKLIFKFDLNRLLGRGETEISVSSEKEKEKTHYTKIIISNPFRMESKEHYEETVIPQLAETFIKFKDFLTIEIDYNNVILSRKRKGKSAKAYFEPPKPLKYPTVDKESKPKDSVDKIWKKKIEINYKNHKVKGYFMIMNTGSYLQPGLRLFRNRRVIQGTIVNPNCPEILFKTKDKFAGQRLYGELHLDDFEIDFMKTKFKENLDPLYRKLKEELKKEHFIEQIDYYRSRKDKKSNKETSDIEQTTSSKEFITRQKNGKEKRKKTTSISKINILSSEKIKNQLEKLEKKKLFHLYNSLCEISFTKHSYLAYIGSSAFLEGLSIIMGKSNDKESFYAFFGNKLNHWNQYKKSKQTKKRIHSAIEEIHKKGNFSKHDFEYEFSDAKQLYNEFKVLENFIIDCINEIQGR